MTARDEAERLVQAAAWQMRLDEADDAARAAFEAWLAEPANARAWSHLMKPWDLIGEHANDQKMVALRHAALNDAKRTSARLHASRPRWGIAAAACLALALAVGGGVWWLQRPDDYQTAFGERRVVTLADGSRISLDSDSEVTVRYSQNARALRLLRGQARFDVAHDVERPFSVIARDQKVIATGTAFNIDITQPKVLVTLIEGHVVVLQENGTRQPALRGPAVLQPPSVELRAGQQLAALPDRAPTVATADIHQATAWTSGQLIFDDQPLAEVVARVNHYSNTPIAIGDRRVAVLRLSGSFNTGDPAGFLDIVTHYLPVREVADANGAVTLRAK